MSISSGDNYQCIEQFGEGNLEMESKQRYLAFFLCGLGPSNTIADILPRVFMTIRNDFLIKMWCQ